MDFKFFMCNFQYQHSTAYFIYLIKLGNKSITLIMIGSL